MERRRDWFDQAEGDLEHARSDAERGFYEWSCFSSQQAAEKALKAVFQRMGAEAWGHSVADLLKELGKTHSVSQELVNLAYELDKAYIGARYPNAHPSGSPRTRYTREEAIRLLVERLPELGKALPLVRVVLFGSHATGAYTVGSDVDVLIVYGGERREDAYATSWRALDLPGLEPHVYTEAEHAQLQGALDRMCASGVVLYPRAEREP